MASNGLPAGWSYEPEDRSVGIFGDAFVHEDCKLEDVREAEQIWTNGDVKLTCACGEVVELDGPEPEEDPYWGDPYYDVDRGAEEEALGRPLFPNEY